MKQDELEAWIEKHGWLLLACQAKLNLDGGDIRWYLTPSGKMVTICIYLVGFEIVTETPTKAVFAFTD